MSENSLSYSSLLFKCALNDFQSMHLPSNREPNKKAGKVLMGTKGQQPVNVENPTLDQQGFWGKILTEASKCKCHSKWGSKVLKGELMHVTTYHNLFYIPWQEYVYFINQAGRSISPCPAIAQPIRTNGNSANKKLPQPWHPTLFQQTCMPTSFFIKKRKKFKKVLCTCLWFAIILISQIAIPLLFLNKLILPAS